MATEKGQEFINKYKGVGILRETWLVMYRKRHITLEELNECIELTEEEKQALKDEQIDICPEPTDKERITKLEEEKAILAENVYQLASILEVMLGGTESGQTTTTTTDTIN